MVKRIVLGIVTPWLLWTGIWVLQDYHGGIEIFTQPVVAMILAVIFAVCAFIAGMPLRNASAYIDNRYIRYALILVLWCGLTLVIFQHGLGLTTTAVHPETGESFQARNPYILALALFLIAFPIINWPKGKDDQGS